ncbi:pyrimidodiazepine synthase-like [Penaeus chinensis]|uniref:pyrimidodiazepine synthase-like n=1 Tax=Penaeus chinensis TaxID=139456 RepID=UPI001FB855E0|nr:pyrimidodiazepine synthase-like [Penaeus chinensis]
MSDKHLAAGSPCPPLQPGVMRIYSMRFCPFAQRVRLVLDAKGVNFELVNINTHSKPDWFLGKSPLGKVPVLERDGEIICESAILSDYLDEVYPEPALYPKDPWKKAHDRSLAELWSKVYGPMYKMYSAKGDKQAKTKAFEDFLSGLDLFERELAKRGSTYFGGERPGMLDYMIWPHAERFAMLTMLAGDGYEIPQHRHPNMFSWINRMKEDPAVKTTYLTPEQHFEFVKGFIGGNPEYDREQ